MEQKRLREYVISCDNPEYSFSEKVQISLPDGASNSQIKHELFEIAHGTIGEYFEDLVLDAVQSFAPRIHGYYNLPKLTKEMYDAANKYLEKETEGLKVCAQLVSGDAVAHKESEVIWFFLHEMLEGVISDRYSCECASCDAGKIIESSLLYFEENGCWQYGFVVGDDIVLEKTQWPTPLQCNSDVKWLKDKCESYPVIWFGLHGEKPLARWTLSRNTTDDDLAFWFIDDNTEQMKMLGQDIDQIFLVWYFFECGNVMPDIEAIRDRCPIKLQKGLTLSELIRRINDFFLNLARNNAKA